MVKVFTNNLVKSNEPFLNLCNQHHNLKVFSYVDLSLTRHFGFFCFPFPVLKNWEAERDSESSKAPAYLFSLLKLLRETDFCCRYGLNFDDAKAHAPVLFYVNCELTFFLLKS